MANIHIKPICKYLIIYVLKLHFQNDNGIFTYKINNNQVNDKIVCVVLIYYNYCANFSEWIGFQKEVPVVTITLATYEGKYLL